MDALQRDTTRRALDDSDYTHFVTGDEHPRTSAQHTPAQRLLPEILAAIFAFHAEANPTNPDRIGVVVPDIPEGMTLAQFKLGWVTVTHVCRHWRLVALDHCTLWIHHRFNLGLEWTTEMLRRAGCAPLNLTFSEQVIPYPPSEENVVHVIPQLLHRANTLTIEEKACTSAVLDTLTLPAPLMRSLTISASRFAVLPRSLFGDVVPNLHHLFLSNALPTWTSAALTCLKSLSITFDRTTHMSNMPCYDDLFNALQTMQNLESLFLMGCIPSGPCHFEQKVQLPKLQCLLLSCHVPGFRQVLEHIKFPPETILEGRCITDDMTGKECCDILPLMLSYLPRPSLETLSVSWGDQFDRVFHIRGYSTSHEEESSGKPSFSLHGSRCFSIGFQFKFLLWSAAQKLRILKAVCSALPTDGLRALSGNLDLGKDAWPEIFGDHKDLRHVRVCSLPTLHTLVPFLSREGVYPKLVSLTLRDMDLSPKRGAAVPFIDGLKTCRSPKPSKIFIENCRVRRDLVDWMRAAVPDVEIVWDEMVVAEMAVAKVAKGTTQITS
ncbi:hypothetical protein BGY98DRAFT_112511 [Russula aff. rugulosa BPL654]|nr:hypothetical protein BGY98DRAFT_112511 [Russula aff. rugulosa BPL654]